MLKYTFSAREKVLLVILALIVVGLAWYQFVFVNVQNQISEIQSQTADAEDTVAVDQAKLVEMNKMQTAIKQYEAEGLKKTAMPSFDNTQNVMNQLNAILASTSNYALTFDDLDTTTETGVVRRGVTLTFGCASYADAKAVLVNLSQGAYPCEIDSVSMVDNTANTTTQSGIVGSGSSTNASTSAFAVTAHVIFFEKADATETTTDVDTSALDAAMTNDTKS